MRRWLPLLFAVALAGSCVGDTSDTLEVRNATDQPIDIVFRGAVLATVGPGETFSDTIVGFDGTATYEFRDQSGELLGSESFTWDRIRDEDGISVTVED
jgi:hypothetical protein